MNFFGATEEGVVCQKLEQLKAYFVIGAGAGKNPKTVENRPAQQHEWYKTDRITFERLGGINIAGQIAGGDVEAHLGQVDRGVVILTKLQGHLVTRRVRQLL